MGRVLIAGAGYVGIELGRSLAAAGMQVVALRRRAELVPAPLRAVAADLSDPASLRALEGPFDAIAYTASADSSSDDDYVKAYITGLENLLSAVAAPRVVFTSSTAVYAQTDGGWVDESSPAESSHFTGKRLREAEALVLERATEGVVLRLGVIYGPGRQSLLGLVREGRASVADGPPEYTNRFHRDDCAGALAHLLTLDNPKSLYLGVDDDPVDRRTMIEWLAQELGAPPPQVKPAGQAQGGRRSLSNKRCRNALLKASGYRLLHPSFRDGYRALLTAP